LGDLLITASPRNDSPRRVGATQSAWFNGVLRSSGPRCDGQLRGRLGQVLTHQQRAVSQRQTPRYIQLHTPDHLPRPVNCAVCMLDHCLEW